jgi:hypothetical protein
MVLYWLRRPRIIIRSTIHLKEEELSNQIRSLSPAQFAAVSQVILTLEQEANEGAAQSVANPTIAISCIGGAEHCRMLLERLDNLRKKPESAQLAHFVPRT